MALEGKCTDRLDPEPLDRWGFPIRATTTLRRMLDAPELSANRKRRLQRGLGSFVDRQMLPGLRELCERQKPGQTFTRNAIAKACGVHRETVRNVERAALKNLRQRLAAKFGTGHSLRALQTLLSLPESETFRKT